jgi:hypothetical protein
MTFWAEAVGSAAETTEAKEVAASAAAMPQNRRASGIMGAERGETESKEGSSRKARLSRLAAALLLSER